MAVPYPRFFLRWERDRPDEELLKFCDYLRVAVPADQLDTSQLEDDLLDDWRLVGNIPTGYGLGSSGAVCAAIYDRYAPEPLRGEALLELLARMEQYFHGRSSGTDPLIAYLQRPLLLGGNQPPVATELPQNWQRDFFLVDTGIERKSSVLINRFLQSHGKNPERIASGWTAPAEAAIEALLRGDRDELYDQIGRIGRYQLRHFPSFVPVAFRDKWRGGADYAIKICGAGGGGMLLGLARSRKRTKEVFGSHLSWLQ